MNHVNQRTEHPGNGRRGGTKTRSLPNASASVDREWRGSSPKEAAYRITNVPVGGDERESLESLRILSRNADNWDRGTLSDADKQQEGAPKNQGRMLTKNNAKRGEEGEEDEVRRSAMNQSKAT